MTGHDPTSPADWYSDPAGRHEYRYWDGSTWTDQVSDAGTVGTDPLGPPTVPASAAAKRPTSTVWVMVAVVVGVAVLAVVAFLVLGGGDDESAGDGAPLEEVGGIELGTGDVQATLIWDTGDDLDLHVVDPDGFEIYFADEESPSGGELDVDQIPGCVDEGDQVENVFWPESDAPEGAYEVFVVAFDDCDDGPTTATLQVRVRGELVVDEEVTVDEDDDSETFRFDA
jgi:hypothetical protein